LVAVVSVPDAVFTAFVAVLCTGAGTGVVPLPVPVPVPVAPLTAEPTAEPALLAACVAVLAAFEIRFVGVVVTLQLPVGHPPVGADPITA
jgi:hypothetical protein